MKNKFLLPVIFIVVFAVSRIPGLLPPNFSAAYAFAFCAGVYFRGALAWWLPLGVMAGTDIGLNFYYQFKNPTENVWDLADVANLFFNYVAFAALIFLGKKFKPQSSLLKLTCGGFFGAILFYFITNTASWLFNPFHNSEYTKNFLGWFIALTKGTGGFPTTLEFFRNTLLSGGIFTALFAASAKATAESPAEKNAGVQEANENSSPETDNAAATEEAKA